MKISLLQALDAMHCVEDLYAMIAEAVKQYSLAIYSIVMTGILVLPLMVKLVWRVM